MNQHEKMLKIIPDIHKSQLKHLHTETQRESLLEGKLYFSSLKRYI